MKGLDQSKGNGGTEKRKETNTAGVSESCVELGGEKRGEERGALPVPCCFLLEKLFSFFFFNFFFCFPSFWSYAFFFFSFSSPASMCSVCVHW